MRRTASTSSRAVRRPALLFLGAALLAASACSTGRTSAPASTPGSAAAEIRAMMEASAGAWNRGDLDGFLAPYARDASFATSSGLVHGLDRVRATYERGYWRDGRGPRDALRFEEFDIRTTGPATAVAFGRFILYDRETDESTATGIFSLTLRRADGHWEIVHDHSSSDG